MIIIPRNQALNFLQESKELNGRNVNISPLNSEESRVNLVLLGFLAAHDPEAITSPPQVVEASRMAKGKTPTGKGTHH